MSNAMIVARRELGAMFRSPLAYVFLVLFVVVIQIFFVLAVFTTNQADLRPFLQLLPWGVVVFASLITMRSWAEERQENTYEMLLTFPMRTWELVVAKFLASFLFVALAIALTFTLPLMLFVLGRPDPGEIAAGYLGGLLLAAAWCAAGAFFSCLSRSQLLAAVLSIIGGMLVLFAGTDIVRARLDPFWGLGLGTLINSMFGAWVHCEGFQRGVVGLGDVLFFVAWTAIFLHLTTLFLSLRRRADSGPTVAAAMALGLACAALASRLVYQEQFVRADLTQDRLYTLSEGTLEILKQTKVPVQVKLYISPQDWMPSGYKELEREITDRLSEMRDQSKGRLRYSVLHLDVGNLVDAPVDEEEQDDTGDELSLTGEKKEKTDEDKKKAKAAAEAKKKSIERRLAAKGVRPFPTQTFEVTETSTKYIYSAIGIAYLERDEELIPQIDERRLPELEYQMANIVAKAIRERPPKIALVTGKKPIDPQMEQIYRRMGQQIPDPYSKLEQFLRAEKYDVEHANLSAHQPMPEDCDALVVVGVSHLDERQKWEIARALREGRPTLLALQRFEWESGIVRGGYTLSLEQTDTGLEDVLAADGLAVSDRPLMDENHVTLYVPNNKARSVFDQSMPLPSPAHVLVKHGSMNAESPLTQRLSSLLYLWGASVTMDAARMRAADLKATVLFSSSDKAWEIPGGARNAVQADLEPAGHQVRSFPLAVQVEGQFANPFEGKSRPAWPPKLEFSPDGRPMPAPPDRAESPIVPSRGKLILTGCAIGFSDSLLGARGLGNAMFLLNCVDSLVLDENLLRVRSKQPTDRAFDKPSDAAAIFWTLTP
ncbi:Gldg family protein, partial [bacterium]|nr:Gldg family protein [bacterium]